MKRVGVSAEGATELEFIKRVIAPYFYENNRAYITPVDMGGNVSIQRAGDEIKKLLRGFDVVTTLYDFYGFKGKGVRTVEMLEEDLMKAAECTSKGLFIPYIQIYEFEALVISDPESLCNQMGSISKTEENEIQAFIDQKGGAEKVNDSKETTPSNRILKLFPQYEKKLHGPPICQKIGMKVLRERCPRFNQWIEKINRGL